MGVHVDGANAFSVDYDLTMPLRRLRQSRGQQATSNEYRASQRTSRSAEHFPSVRHQHFPRRERLYSRLKIEAFFHNAPDPWHVHLGQPSGSSVRPSAASSLPVMFRTISTSASIAGVLASAARPCALIE